MKFDIYTGYYAQMKNYRKAGLIPVSIAWGTPVWYEGETCFEVAPPYKLIKAYKTEGMSIEEYSKKYIEHLDTNVKWSAVLKRFKEISDKYKGADLVLVCFEKPEDFCHRHLLADYLNDDDICDCMEWKVK